MLKRMYMHTSLQSIKSVLAAFVINLVGSISTRKEGGG